MTSNEAQSIDCPPVIERRTGGLIEPLSLASNEAQLDYSSESGTVADKLDDITAFKNEDMIIKVESGTVADKLDDITAFKNQDIIIKVEPGPLTYYRQESGYTADKSTVEIADIVNHGIEEIGYISKSAEKIGYTADESTQVEYAIDAATVDVKVPEVNESATLASNEIQVECAATVPEKLEVIATGKKIGPLSLYRQESGYSADESTKEIDDIANENTVDIGYIADESTNEVCYTVDERNQAEYASDDATVDQRVSGPNEPSNEAQVEDSTSVPKILDDITAVKHPDIIIKVEPGPLSLYRQESGYNGDESN